MSLYNELRGMHPLFVYHSFTLSEGALEFHFSIDEYHFYPRWEFDKALYTRDHSRAQAERAAFSLGMAELVSYWKCACCPRVEILCGGLTEKQKKWWKKLYFNGLGEFFYRNGIEADFEDFMTIDAPEPAPLPLRNAELNGVLVPIGGGKDSVVTVELLKKAGADIYPYIINPRGAASTKRCWSLTQRDISTGTLRFRQWWLFRLSFSQ